MCLEQVMRGKEKEEFLEKLPDKITVWKNVLKWAVWKDILEKYPGKYTTDCRRFPLHAGEVKFKQNIIKIYARRGYRGGGHFWLTRKGARSWRSRKSWNRERIIKCVIKKEWINSIGTQDGYKGLVVKKAIFPDFIGKKA